VLILIDHQPWVAFGVTERHKVNPAVMKNGAGVGLALEQAFAQS